MIGEKGNHILNKQYSRTSTMYKLLLVNLFQLSNVYAHSLFISVLKFIVGVRRNQQVIHRYRGCPELFNVGSMDCQTFCMRDVWTVLWSVPFLIKRTLREQGFERQHNISENISTSTPKKTRNQNNYLNAIW